MEINRGYLSAKTRTTTREILLEKICCGSADLQNSIVEIHPMYFQRRWQMMWFILGVIVGLLVACYGEMLVEKIKANFKK